MITIYECTDCKHCACFDGDAVLICLHPALAAGDTIKYAPTTRDTAQICPEFEEGAANYIPDKVYEKAYEQWRKVQNKPGADSWFILRAYAKRHLQP